MPKRLKSNDLKHTVLALKAIMSLENQPDLSAGECCARAQLVSYAKAESQRFARRPTLWCRLVSWLRQGQPKRP